MQTRLFIGGMFVDGLAGSDAIEEHVDELARLEWVNSYKRVNPGSPFGVGMSGYGREMGFEAMHEYTQPKSVWVNVGGEVPDWYGS